MISIVNQPILNNTLQLSKPLTTESPDNVLFSKAPRAYDFESQMQVGNIGEECFEKFCARYIKHGKMTSIVDVRKYPEFWNKDIDYICHYANGNQRTFEVKCDTRTTGNLFAESHVTSYRLRGEELFPLRDKKYGWLYGSDADYVFYYFFASKVIYIVSIKHLSLWVDYCLLPDSMKRNLRERKVEPFKKETQPAKPFTVRSAYNKKPSEKEFYFGIGYCIPIKDIEKSEMMKGHWWKFPVTSSIPA